MKSVLLPAVAAVAVVLGACSGGTPAADVTPATSPAASEAVAADLVIEATDALQFKRTSLRAAAGELTLQLVCGAAVPHTLVIEDVDDDATIADCKGGESATGTVTLAAGTYTFYCSIPGHRATMEGVLEVS